MARQMVATFWLEWFCWRRARLRFWGRPSTSSRFKPYRKAFRMLPTVPRLCLSGHTFPGIAQMVVYPELGFSFLAAHDDSQADVDSVDPLPTLISLTFFTPQQQDLLGLFHRFDGAFPNAEWPNPTSRGLTGAAIFIRHQVLGSDFDVQIMRAMILNPT